MSFYQSIRNIPLYLWILLGVISGLCYSVFIMPMETGALIGNLYIKPIGRIFLNLLTMLAIPLVLTSVITGIGSIKDLQQLSRIGLRTVLLFLCTCLTATIIGIAITSFIKPGVISKHADIHAEQTQKSIALTTKAERLEAEPLQPLLDAFPSNIFAAFSNNESLLQVVIIAVLFGIALSRLSDQPYYSILMNLFEGFNSVLLTITGFIMKLTPVGVFAIIASQALEWGLFKGLLWYVVCVLIGLCLILFALYPLLFMRFSKVRYVEFFKAMRPVFTTAFGTSSSSATLPLTMKVTTETLGLPKKIADFVLPLGTTINMDGTALYQVTATLFIAQYLHIDLGIQELIIISLTATLASIGAAGVPGAGLITLMIILKSVGIPLELIAIILIPDRVLDMCRTIVNVAGDVTGTAVISGMENKYAQSQDKPEP